MAIKQRDDAERQLKEMGVEIFHMPSRPIDFYEVKPLEERPLNYEKERRQVHRVVQEVLSHSPGSEETAQPESCRPPQPE